MTFNPPFWNYLDDQYQFGNDTQSPSATPKQTELFDHNLEFFIDDNIHLNNLDILVNDTDLEYNEFKLIVEIPAIFPCNHCVPKVLSTGQGKTPSPDRILVPKIMPKVISKNQASERKNIHRYITRQIIRALASDECHEQLELICKRLNISVDVVIEYFK
jgi:hypothetical protein